MKEVLHLVNLARSVQGLPEITTLPKGDKCDTDSCPLARGCNAEFAGPNCVGFADEIVAEAVAVAWGVGRRHASVETPAALNKFIYDFDNDMYPELVA